MAPRHTSFISHLVCCPVAGRSSEHCLLQAQPICLRLACAGCRNNSLAATPHLCVCVPSCRAYVSGGALATTFDFILPAEFHKASPTLQLLRLVLGSYCACRAMHLSRAAAKYPAHTCCCSAGGSSSWQGCASGRAGRQWHRPRWHLISDGVWRCH